MNDDETEPPGTNSDNASFVWPDVPRLCFGPGHDRSLDANVEWVQSRRDMYAYAEGYRRAALALLNSMPRHEQNPDLIVWPLAFLWRHCIELMLKDIIAKGRAIECDQAVFPEHHRLMDLWREARQHIARCGSEESPELPNVEAALNEFQKIDPGATGFRYPVARNGAGRSLPDAPDCINLRALQTTMEGLSNFLGACLDMLSAHLESLHESDAWNR